MDLHLTPVAATLQRITIHIKPLIGTNRITIDASFSKKEVSIAPALLTGVEVITNNVQEW